MVLPSGVTRLAGSDTIEPAALRVTVSVLQVSVPSDRRPQLYFLHGYPGSASDPFTAGLARTLNGLLQQGYPPFVFAVVDGNGEHHADTEWANAADGSDQVMDRVVDAAIPAVEGTHMRDAAHRAIAGFSMGGYGAMNIAMQENPGVFGQVVSIAGYFVVNDPSGLFGGRPRAVVAQNAPSAHPRPGPEGLRLLLDQDALRARARSSAGRAARMGGPAALGAASRSPCACSRARTTGPTRRARCGTRSRSWPATRARPPRTTSPAFPRPGARARRASPPAGKGAPGA